jgi:hypothetical protein
MQLNVAEMLVLKKKKTKKKKKKKKKTALHGLERRICVPYIY